MRSRRIQRHFKVERPGTVWSEACKKFAYPNKKIAKYQASIQAKNSGEQIEAYRCTRGCRAWHIGHPPGTRRDP
jgi:hypothetical protein